MKVALLPLIAVALGSSMALAQNGDDPIFCGDFQNPAPGTFHARCRDAQQQVAGQCTASESVAYALCASPGSHVGICIGCNGEVFDMGTGPVYDISSLRTGSDRSSANKAFNRLCSQACSVFAIETAWSTIVRNNLLAQCECTEPNPLFPVLPLSTFTFSDVKAAQPATSVPVVQIPDASDPAPAPAPAAPAPAAPADPSGKEPAPGANVPLAGAKTTENFGVQGFKTALGPVMAVACVAAALML
ncbi:hypothetical protein HDU85_004084 [Gaertneriomyces sp. JEL0708]|nr:hypothetical protein HDU85_004084 [Gaertneriomyces sp. JEL0708]